jgi:hypothetical protein
LADGARLGVQYAFEDSGGEDETDGEEVEEQNQDVGEGDAATVITDADATHAAGYTINRCHQSSEVSSEGEGDVLMRTRHGRQETHAEH